MVLLSTLVVACSGGGSSSSSSSASVCGPPQVGTAVPNPTANTIARTGHTATLLPNDDPNKVVVLTVGGQTVGGISAGADLYHPATSEWSSTGDLNVPRTNHAATLLATGVLVSGGNDSNGFMDSAEIYDIDKRTWGVAAKMSLPRFNHSATRFLKAGNEFVLLVGGQDLNGVPVKSADLYDSTQNSWSPTQDLNIVRSGHTATLLKSGDVLVVGGWNSTGPIGSVELYDSAKDSWSLKVNLNISRIGHTATLLSDNMVFVAGGYNGDGTLSSSELYDVKIDLWTLTGSLGSPRSFHTATLLPDGSLLVTGGTSLRSELVPAERVTPGVQATLEWDRVSDPTLLGYKVYYGTTSKSYQGAAILDRETKYIFGSLTKGTMYYFAVTSFSGIGESCSSNEVSKFIP